ncbi:MAG: alpha/beta hydrolase [Winogradskyella sp.]
MNRIKLTLLAFAFSILGFSQTKIITEDILLKNDSIQLPGTLTYTKNETPQPLVIFIHGSGNVDRNGNQPGLSNANYIKQLSDSLALRNIAFYRYDKRTATPSNIKFIMKALYFEKFVEDAELAIKHFKDDKRFSNITLIGHSQGSLIAMLASKHTVNKYISLAGPANTIDVSIVKQIKLQNGDSLATLVKAHFKELRETGTIKNVDPNLLSLFNAQNIPFIKSWMAYNPTEEIKALNIPVLILNGTKDLQVFENDAKALHAAKTESQLIMIKDMNHVLKTITNNADNKKSYSAPDFPLSKKLITALTKFIKK